MEFQKGKIFSYQGKNYKMQSILGDIITAKCAIGCPKVIKVHKDQI
jgi:hypothetical protein